MFVVCHVGSGLFDDQITHTVTNINAVTATLFIIAWQTKNFLYIVSE